MGQAGVNLTKDLPRPILVPGKATGFFTEFPVYLKRMEMAGILTNEAKLDTLGRSLPPAGYTYIQLKQVEALRGASPPVRYEDIWAWVVRNYGGGDDQQAILSELRALRP